MKIMIDNDAIFHARFPNFLVALMLQMDQLRLLASALKSTSIEFEW